MAGKQAKILSETELKRLLLFASRTRHSLRNRVIVLLSAKAGLRAGEIASLTWDMLLDPQGRVGVSIELRDTAAKKRSGRRIALHPDLGAALKAWRKASTEPGYVVRSERGGQLTPLSVVVWFNRAFHRIGLSGCSSHSGRRTFITRAARLAHLTGGSLRDVQLLAGHRSIETTQRYIDGDTDAQRKLVTLLRRRLRAPAQSWPRNIDTYPSHNTEPCKSSSAPSAWRLPGVDCPAADQRRDQRPAPCLQASRHRGAVRLADPYL